MGAQLAAFVYSAIAFASIYCVARFVGTFSRSSLEWVVIAFFVTSFLFFLLSPAVLTFLLAAIFLLIVANRLSITQRICFFLGCLPAVSQQANYLVPAVGIDYLLLLQYPLLLSLAVLAPIIPQLIGGAGRDRLASHSLLLWVLFFYLGVDFATDVRDSSLTNGIRHLFIDFFIYVLPIFAIVSFTPSLVVFQRYFSALIIGLLLACGLAIMHQLIGWKFSSAVIADLDLSKSFHNVYDYRGGLIRSGGTIMPIPFGILCSISFVWLLSLANYRWLSWRAAAMWILLLGVAISGSRAAFLVIPVALSSIWILNRIKPTMTGILFLFLGLMFAGYTLGEVVIALDPLGTFSYRAEMLRSSIPVFASNPIFGAPSEVYLVPLEHMRQGQGIIDIVNSYIQIGLKSGLLGLMSFIGVWLLTFRSIAKGYFLAASSPSLRSMLVLQAALLCVLVASLFSVSLVDYLPQYYWVFIGLSLGLANVANSSDRVDVTKVAYPTQP